MLSFILLGFAGELYAVFNWVELSSYTLQCLHQSGPGFSYIMTITTYSI